MAGRPSYLADRLALSVPEAAQALGISERHLRALLPEIPHVVLGKRIVIPVEPLRSWLAERAKSQQGRVDATVGKLLRSLGGHSE